MKNVSTKTMLDACDWVQIRKNRSPGRKLPNQYDVGLGKYILKYGGWCFGSAVSENVDDAVRDAFNQVMTGGNEPKKKGKK